MYNPDNPSSPPQQISEEEKLKRYYEWVAKASTGDYAVRTINEHGDIEMGNAELLPQEQLFDFGDVRTRLEAMDPKYQNDVKEVMNLVLPDNQKIPLAIEVGREGIAGGNYYSMAFSPFDADFLAEKIKQMVDMNIISPLEASGLATYVHCSLEEMSKIFSKDHRANLIYLGQVLTKQ